MSFWRGKSVLLTGHTGFKGAWAAHWLAAKGARVTGLALPPESTPNLYDLLGQAHLHGSHLVDLRDMEKVEAVVREAAPDLVLHMAAQPLVRRSYADPVETFGSNVMGTVHLLEALRRNAKPQAILVITSDKVYENDGSGRAYCETDRLGGHDPYSASKAATEIVTASYRDAFFADLGIPLATARGGNVVGGGDFSEDRLVPDIVRALGRNEPVALRNPHSTRPWQHVLDCLDGYFTYLLALAQRTDVPHSLNFGPEAGTEAITVAELTDTLLHAMGRPSLHRIDGPDGPHEMAKLAIDPTRAAQVLNWRPRLSPAQTVKMTADWYAAFLAGADVRALTTAQIKEYEDLTP